MTAKEETKEQTKQQRAQRVSEEALFVPLLTDKDKDR